MKNHQPVTYSSSLCKCKWGNVSLSHMTLETRVCPLRVISSTLDFTRERRTWTHPTEEYCTWKQSMVVSEGRQSSFSVKTNSWCQLKVVLRIASGFTMTRRKKTLSRHLRLPPLEWTICESGLSEA